jgi:hypothetical protein
MSLKGDKYESAEEVERRLNGTVVLYEGKPVVINAVEMPQAGDDDAIARVYFYELPQKPGAKRVRKFLSSRKFDLAPFKMGYCNYNGAAVYVTRNPVRQGRQGLASGVTSFKSIDDTPIRLPFELVTASQAFADMVAGVYPSLKEAIPLIEGKIESVALSRAFALELDDELDLFIIRHKGKRCGIVLRDRGIVQLSRKYTFLKEELKEAGLS